MVAAIGKIKVIGLYLFAALLFLFIMFPFFWIVSSSFKSPNEIFGVPPSFIPNEITLDNYVRAIQDNNILLFLQNSTVITVISTVIVTIIATLAAYALVYYKFRATKPTFAFLIVTQMVPVAFLLAPLFLIFSQLGLINSYSSLIITYLAYQLPIAVILMTGFLVGIPNELEESARVDGCNSLQVFYKIIFPLAAPGVVATSILVFINLWQEFLFALSFITNQGKYTLPVGITTFLGQHSTDWGGLMATSVIIAIPSIFLFLSVQKYFIDNLAGSVKG